MVCLGREGDDNYKGILKLLGTLLVSSASAEEKKRILRDEFGIEAEQGIDEGVLEMCNLSRGVEARGIKKGRREGLAEGLSRGRREGLREGRSEGLREGRSEGLREGRSEGRNEGRREGLLDSLRNLMNNLHLNAADAMNALGIPAEEQQQYIDLLAGT